MMGTASMINIIVNLFFCFFEINLSFLTMDLQNITRPRFFFHNSIL